MRKRRWIFLTIVIIIICGWATYFLFYKQQTCQDFIDECYKQNFEFYAWGWHMYIIYPDWSTSLDYKANCPQDCSRYTEERWYFKNKIRQKIYYYNKVKKCEKEYEECLQNWQWRFGCHKCNKYWDPIYEWN